MNAKPLLVLALVVAATFGYIVHSALVQRDTDLRRISCDALRREVASRQSAVASGRLFSKHLGSQVLRAYYQKALPTRIERRDEARAEFARLNCPEREAP